MILLIAHRGLVEGPNESLENRPDQIQKTISHGYDCEVDLWLVSGKLYLGHNNPEYIIKEDFLLENSNKLWIHAKNLNALEWLTDTNLNYFWHENDSFTLTSKKYIWTYPKNALSSKSVCVMPEQFMKIENCYFLNCYGICSDFILQINRVLDYD